MMIHLGANHNASVDRHGSLSTTGRKAKRDAMLRPQSGGDLNILEINLPSLLELVVSLASDLQNHHDCLPFHV